jgi:hypothetical protein
VPGGGIDSGGAEEEDGRVEPPDLRPSVRAFRYPAAARWLHGESETIEVDDRGIAAFDRGREFTFVRWVDVEGIEERRIRHRIEIHDGSGNVIRIGYRIEGFEELLRIVLPRACRERKGPIPEVEEFSPDWASSVIVLLPVITFVGAGAVAAFSIGDRFLMPALSLSVGVLLTLSLIFFLFILIPMSRVLIEADRVSVKGIWAAGVLLADVASVSIHCWEGRGTQVVLLLRSGKKRYLPPVRGGSFALYRALRARLDSIGLDVRERST